MEILIDTHIFLWLATDPDKLSQKHLALLQARKNRLYLSAMSIVEVMIKHSIGQINVPFDMMKACEMMEINLLDFDATSAMKLGTLPMHHKDPFDRMLIAQAITHNMTFCTVDRKMAYYVDEGLELL